MEVQTPGQAFAAFLGALGFTRPVEQLELRSVPLPSLLFWLSRPKSSNLVEATTQAEEVKTTSACRSMAIYRFTQGRHAKDVPDNRWEAEAGRLLPILWRY